MTAQDRVLDYIIGQRNHALDLVAALAAERDELAARVAELERVPKPMPEQADSEEIPTGFGS